MVAHDGIAADFDGEDGGELFEAVANPGLAVFVVAPGDRVDAAEEGPADTPGDAVIDPDSVGGNDRGTWIGWHRSASQGVS
jgi:hypothetical protein